MKRILMAAAMMGMSGGAYAENNSAAAQLGIPAANGAIAAVSVPARAAGSEAAVPAVPVPAQPKTCSKAIYGSDDRLDYYQTNATIKALSDSVVSLWPSQYVSAEDGTAYFLTSHFGREYNLCPGQKFAEQPTGAFCSGFLLGEDVVVTAGHCITDQTKCDKTTFVFGYSLKKAGDYPMSVPVGDVYSCKSIIQRGLDQDSGFFHALVSSYNGGPGPDFALIKLNRKVTGRKPLAINKNAKLAKGDKLFIIGHPAGLPLKVAGNAQVLDASPSYFFWADLDVVGGNSGSPVFNARTNLIEGIMSRGGDVYVDTPNGCRVASAVPQNGGRGDEATKISVVEKFMR